LAKDLRPTKMSDISAMVALYRPGPMDLIPMFIEGKNNPKKIRYLHPDLGPILSETYGILVYQEQVMEIAHRLASYTISEADNLRMAMGKKKKALMKKEQEKFIAGCIKNKYSKKLAEEIWNFMEKFASYGFNKAHSASYGLIAYWTAFLKANYPVQYMTALLTAELQGVAGPMREIKMAQALEECRRMKINVLPPDINKSQADFHIEKDSIRFGLSAIKNVGASAIEAILEARKSEVFTGFKDFLAKVDLRRVNKKTVESLVKANAFLNFANRATLLYHYPSLVKEISEYKADQEKGQFGLFTHDGTSKKMVDDFKIIDEFPEEEISLMEKEVIGFLITKNPLSNFKNIIAKKTNKKIGELNNGDIGKNLILAGIVSSRKITKTKKDNHEMAFITLFDETGSVEVVVFPKIYNKLKELIAINHVLMIKGTINDRDGKITVLMDNGVDLEKLGR